MAWWQYLLLANVYLVLFYGFYAIMLRRETFFQLNRVYLVSTAMLSFIIPLVQAQWVQHLFITQRISQTIYGVNTISIYDVQLNTSANTGINLGQVLATVYLMGIVFLLVRFLLQLLLLYRGLQHRGNTDAYSFFKTIKLGTGLANGKVIMAHEQVHAQQWHSADVLLMEVLFIINWFNPVVYLYRRAVKHVHEFIADRNALKAGAGKHEYALLLLSQTFNIPANQLVNSFFNHSLLKQRIMMLQKNGSRRTALLKYGLSAPLFALMLIMSSATAKTAGVINKINSKAAEVMLLEAASAGNNLPKAAVQVGPPPVPAVNKSQPKRPYYTSPSQTAEFPGGVDAFGKFLAKNIRITPQIKKAMPFPKIIVQFIVEENGSLTDIKVLRGQAAPAAEAVRVLSMSPRWKPGMQNGRPVRQQYTVPVSFAQNATQKMGAVPPAGLQNRPGKLQVSSPDTHPLMDTTSIRFKTWADNPNIIYFVDGVKQTQNNMNGINPNDIESIEVFKNGQYPTGLNVPPNAKGVVMVATKNKK